MGGESGKLGNVRIDHVRPSRKRKKSGDKSRVKRLATVRWQTGKNACLT